MLAQPSEREVTQGEARITPEITNKVRGVGRHSDVRRNHESDQVILQDHHETGVRTTIVTLSLSEVTDLTALGRRPQDNPRCMSECATIVVSLDTVHRSAGRNRTATLIHPKVSDLVVVKVTVPQDEITLAEVHPR